MRRKPTVAVLVGVAAAASLALAPLAVAASPTLRMHAAEHAATVYVDEAISDLFDSSVFGDVYSADYGTLHCRRIGRRVVDCRFNLAIFVAVPCYSARESGELVLTCPQPTAQAYGPVTKHRVRVRLRHGHVRVHSHPVPNPEPTLPLDEIPSGTAGPPDLG